MIAFLYFLIRKMRTVEKFIIALERDVITRSLGHLYITA
jgi:hypothetical protein